MKITFRHNFIRLCPSCGNSQLLRVAQFDSSEQSIIDTPDKCYCGNLNYEYKCLTTSIKEGLFEPEPEL